MKFVLSFLLLFGFINLYAQSKQLSPSADISVLTCSAGNELYSIYGHSAIRVKDSTQNIDIVFNYGTFDFNTPNFYLKFINGDLNYMLSINEYSRFIQSYFNDNRSVYEQVLAVSPEQKQRIFDDLIINYQPENRYYRYDFFFDNCATRIRDLLFNALDNNVQIDLIPIPDKSFRTLIHEFLGLYPWVLDGQDLLLGVGTDKIASINQQMFLPSYMMVHFARANLMSDNHITPLVKQTNILLEFETDTPDVGPFSPSLYIWILFLIIIALSIYELRIRRQSFTFINRLLFLFTGLIGLLICYLWFFTKHGVTNTNLNLLWALPTNLILALSSRRFWNTLIIRSLMYFSLGSILLVFCFSLFSIQNFPHIVYPILLIMLVRYIQIIYHNKPQHKDI